MRVSLPNVDIEYYNDKILVTKKTINAETGEDFMFLSSDFKDWKSGPDYFYYDNGKNFPFCRNEDIAGWTHIFRDDWDVNEKHNIFVKYVQIFVVEDKNNVLPRVILPNMVIECYNDKIVFTTYDVIEYFFDVNVSTDERLKILDYFLEQYILDFLEH